MVNISWGLTVRVDGREAVSLSTEALAVEAIDTLEVQVEPGEADKLVQLVPGAAEALRLLVIESDTYGEHLSFVASDGTDDAPAVTLHAPEVYARGGVALFGLAPNQLKLTNTSGEGANVRILVARDATP